MRYNKPRVLLTMPALSTIQGATQKGESGKDNASGHTLSTPAGYDADE